MGLKVTQKLPKIGGYEMLVKVVSAFDDYTLQERMQKAVDIAAEYHFELVDVKYSVVSAVSGDCVDDTSFFRSVVMMFKSVENENGEMPYTWEVKELKGRFAKS